MMEFVGPALIVLMVGALVFFLIEVFYRGPHSFRLRWVLGLFTFASVLVSRIAVEEGHERASLFGLALSVATLIVTVSLVDFEYGSLAFVEPVVVIIFIAVVMWSTNRLTWDCTVIDDSRDVSSIGLMEHVKRKFQKLRKVARKDSNPSTDSTTTGHSNGAAVKHPKSIPEKLLFLFFTSAKYQNTPGLWVFYFALAAFPIFGFGQWFAQPSAGWGYRWIFFLFAIYLGSGLGLLMLTSLLGLERYLKKRGAFLPSSISQSWMLVGTLFALAVMLIMLVLPSPSLSTGMENALGFLTTRNKNTSEHAFGDDGQQEGQDARNQNRKNDADANQQQPGKQGNGEGGKGGQAKSKQSGNESSGSKQSNKNQSSSDNQQSASTENSSRQKSSDNNQSSRQNDNSEQNDRSNDAQSKADASDEDRDQQDSSDSGKSDQPRDKSGQRPESRRENDAQKNNDNNDRGQDDNTRREPDRAQNNPANQNQANNRNRGANNRQQDQQRQPAQPNPPSSSSPSGLGKFLSGAIRFLVYAVGLVTLIVVIWMFREELAKLWNELFGGKSNDEVEPEPTSPAARAGKPLPGFAQFTEPFSNGLVNQWPASRVVEYTFSALEAWARDHQFPRDHDQTPHEFARQLDEFNSDIGSEARTLADLLGQCLYSGGELAPADSLKLKKIWNLLTANPPQRDLQLVTQS